SRGMGPAGRSPKRSGLPVRLAIGLAATLALAAGGPKSHAYEERGLEPTADYKSIVSAREAVWKIVNRVVKEIGGPRKAIRVERHRGMFHYWYARDSVASSIYTIVVTDTTECPMMRLEYALNAAGWTVHNAYVADGPDGGQMGFLSKKQFCFVEGRWDGGDDSDSLYTPAPGCSIAVTCVPRRADDVPR
ncbi:MAG TPA: hypothetical protein VJ776_10035, partial [Thermoanaerobaculia bacterium]|nr:hypothetical protein [Thermoanaerobaculia bacterium]